tara:strand:+ start:747 stop:1058 length:312 start_codon:yes stop_codon:yes gene_type:complete
LLIFNLKNITKNNNKKLRKLNMIIPVRCFGCGFILGNKYDYFMTKVIERKQKLNQKPDRLSVVNLSSQELKKTIEGAVLDEIGCIRPCCRAKMLAHIPLIEEL